MSVTLKWLGVDRGREGMLRAAPWFKTLEILAHHAGEDLSDLNSPVFTELEQSMPGNAWRGKAGRPFFRDYQQAWTTLGVLTPTVMTEQCIVITPKGKRLLEAVKKAGSTKNPLQKFFRTVVQYYVEEWKTPSGALTVSPYEIIASALLASPDNIVKTVELQSMAEVLAAVRACPGQKATFEQGDTPARRFRSYLTLLENAGAIIRQPGSVRIQDRQFLQSLVREGLEGFAPFVPADGAKELNYPDFVWEDLRRRESREIAVREGQQEFAEKLKKAYGGRCCITGCGEAAVLQACHIVDYCGRQSNVPSNGLLLAADIHLLFDRLLLGINPDSMCVVLSDSVKDKRYRGLNGVAVRMPADQRLRPGREALEAKFVKFIEKDALGKGGAARSS